MSETNKALEAAKRNLKSAGGWEDANRDVMRDRFNAAQTYALVAIAEELHDIVYLLRLAGEKWEQADDE